MFANAIALLLGACLIHGLPELPEWQLAVPVCLVAWVAALVLRCPRLAWCLAGMLWVWGHASWRLAHDLPAGLEGVDLEVSGFVGSLPERTANGVRFVLDIRKAPDTATRFPQKIDLTWYDAPVTPGAGEYWQFTVRLRRRHAFANPGGFDYEMQLFREGTGATGYVREDGGNRRLAEPTLAYAVLRIREHIANRLAAALEGHPQLGIIQGLTVGERQHMTLEQWRVFAATGTSHLMAISGLHIAMVASLSAMLGAGLVHLPGMQRRRFAASDGQAAGGMAGALLYAALAGFEVPAQRTLVMLCVWWSARLRRRMLRPTQGLALSLLAVLAVDPFAPLFIGAWLSFGAVSAILWVLAGRPRTRRKALWGKVREFLQIQGAVTIGLLPPLVYAFGAVSLVSPLVNLLAIPFFTLLLVPLTLVGTALLLIWPDGGAGLLQVAAGLLDMAWPMLVACARWAGGMWYPASGPAWTLWLVTLGAAIALAPGFPVTRLTGLLLCLPALFWRPAALQEGEFRLTVLDVGQGLAAVVETRSHVLLYDAGPAFRSGRDTGEMVVLPFLRSRGVRRLDTVIASHGDNDHVGGLPSVLAVLPARRVLAGPSVTTLPGAEACIKGEHWQWDGVEFSFLHPDAADGWRNKNESSCVLRIAATGGSALLPGDIESGSEAELVTAGLLTPTDIVVAPHHGSRTSSTAAFVAALAARQVIYAAGYRNRWGFPRPDVVMRWEEGGASWDTTADAGAISVLVAASGVGTERYRESHRRYWRVPATIRPRQQYPAPE